MITINDQLLLSNILPLDYRKSNIVLNGSIITVEQINEYLERVDLNSRFLGLEVLIVSPKGTYPINTFVGHLINGEMEYSKYVFKSGITDQDFIEYSEEQSDWNIENSELPGYIKNKPFNSDEVSKLKKGLITVPTVSALYSLTGVFKGLSIFVDDVKLLYVCTDVSPGGNSWEPIGLSGDSIFERVDNENYKTTNKNIWIDGYLKFYPKTNLTPKNGIIYYDENNNLYLGEE